VPSAIPYLEQARVAVMPLAFGAGTKRKVIQALMVGTPAVASTIACEGLELRDGEHLLVADDPVGFARAVTRLLEDDELWQHLAAGGQAHMRSIRSREGARQALLAAVSRVQERRPKPADQALRLALDGPSGTPVVGRHDQRVRRVVREQLPRGSTVLVATHGQGMLLDVAGYTVRGFPGDGQEMVSGEMGIQALEEQRRAGAGYLVIPPSARPWLSYHANLERYLRRSHREVAVPDEAGCLIYSLSERAAESLRPNIDSHAAERSVSTRPALRFGQSENARYPGGSPTAGAPSLAGESMLAELRAKLGHDRVLVIGTYRAHLPNTMEHIVAEISGAERCDVTQRWVAVGGQPDSPRVGAATVRTLLDPRPKFEVLNELLSGEDLDAYDFIVVMDDDVLLPPAFLDTFLAVQTYAGFVLVQPAKTSTSNIGLPIVEQQRGTLARRTLLVQPGPVVSIQRSAHELLMPFYMSSPAGYGYENVWAYEIDRRGHKLGIVDAVPVEHSLREPDSASDWDRPDMGRTTLLRDRPHLSQLACNRVLDIIPLGIAPTVGL
jgi:hypothetical protein